MNTILFPNSERHQTQMGWLNSYFTFSFSNWYNPLKENFGALRVLNDDTIAPLGGFGMHPHDNMEIITIVLEGTLEHKDTMGNTAQIQQGEIQVMSAGTGLMHSEYNPSSTQPLKLFQIWIYPLEYGIKPRYDQRKFEGKPNDWNLVVSGKKERESLWINQEASFHLGIFDSDQTITLPKLWDHTGLFLMVVDGEISVKDQVLSTRDAIGLSQIQEEVTIKTLTSSRLLLIEVPMEEF